MERENKCYAYFSITGDFDPDEISAKLGVDPTETWRKGSLIASGRQRHQSRWSLYSRLEKNASLEDHVRDVFAQMDAKPTAFASVSAECDGLMQLVGYFHSEYPGLYFERDIVERLNRYHLTIDFDFYGLYSHRLNDTER